MHIHNNTLRGIIWVRNIRALTGIQLAIVWIGLKIGLELISANVVNACNPDLSINVSASSYQYLTIDT